MSNRTGYQPLTQAIDEEEDVGDGAEFQPSGPPTRGLRRSVRPGSIDLRSLDQAFKRYVWSLAGINLCSTDLLGAQMDRVHCSESEAEEEGYPRVYEETDMA